MTQRTVKRASGGAVLVNVVFLWAATAIAATALWPIYEGRGILIVVAVATVVGTAIAVLGSRFAWPAWLVMAVTAVAFLAVGVPTAVPSKANNVVLPSIEGLIDLVSGVALGWKQLLTITLPVGDYEALLVPALVLVLGTVTIGLSIALRARHRELAVLAPAVLYVVALAFGPDLPTRSIVTPLALFGVILLWLAWFRWYRRREAIAALVTTSGGTASTRDVGSAGVRSTIGALVILAIAAGAGVTAAVAVPPSESRTVLRTTIVQPFDPRDYVSPLAGFRGYWQEGTVDSVLFRVDGLDGRLLRLATLDTYDGVVYSVGSDRVTSESGSFVRVPSTFDQSTVTGDQVSIDVEVADYSGVWVPTVGKFESIDFSGADAASRRDAFFYNDTSGAAAVVGGITQGDRYALTAVAPQQPAESELSDLDPGSATVPGAPAPPEEVTEALERYTEGVDGAGPQLVAMLDGLASEGYISHGTGEDEPPSRSGHATDRIVELFTAPRMIGDAEQYSVAAAIMARQIGFPSRVVMGFVPDGGVVRGGDVVAWLEVNTAQYGWVAIDATPPFRDIPEELPEENAQVARPPTIVPPPVVETEPTDRLATPDSERELPPDLDPVLEIVLAVLRVVGWVLLALGILVSPFLLVIAAKVRRRSLRRRTGTPVDRITGGWREFEDAVIDHGLGTGAAATRSEIAAVTGAVQAQVLAAVADRAVFSPDEAPVTDAETVWRAVDDLRASLDDGLTRWERVKARISLRSLGGYSVSKLFTR
ncbi:hypothetical protein HDC94_001529 [Leifsonia sp. AK011]|uniref:transglutaminase domain-containing protein n=1 Tax=Leifsonia sp. AK011 TaxID=2723075 RepID=UPI0015CB4896|nr:transglutaminase domain-containing protein [Leifsonia sp. AK011]NYF10373.1 hypothetical protein [Leifsonia sp. AK011]